MNPSYSLIPATPSELPQLIPLVQAYHQFEDIDDDAGRIRQALLPLLSSDDHGKIWLIEFEQRLIGYVAICFGYSIEFAGRDAFLDELFIVAEYRGQGFGRQVLTEVLRQLDSWQVKALHLEVERNNHRARELYRSLGFKAREKYTLMTYSSDKK